MIRAALFAILLSAVAARADVDVAPPPRNAGDPFVPPKAVAKQENPAETVTKIIKNAKEVTDRLAKSDAGTDTRKTQDDTLALIDQLLNRQDDPPPKSDKDKSDKSDKDDSPDKKDKQDGDGKGGKKDMKSDGDPKEGNGKGGMGQPKDGDGKDQQAKGRRPRNQGQDKGGEDAGDQTASAKNGDMNPKGGMTPGAGDIGGKPIPPQKPTLPVDDDVAKDVWGHLPDKLRKEVTQYYREEFMPRYSELLKQYYSSLSDKKGEKR